ncbi:hypothetical protein [Bacillus manliponensis]|uniref:hypothetical protein n=1 Tax=Bacillus manliponensis TaxID=574376 RepID=UPI0035142328
MISITGITYAESTNSSIPTKQLIESISSNDGWQFINEKWYYYKDGEVQVGWQIIQNNWYYFDESGVMLIG